MNGQINYQVNFTANLSSVQTALNSLRTSLNNLVNRPVALDNSQIIQATNDARELQRALEAATNVNTGKLDMTKFSQQLQMSGKTIQQYGQSLATLGPQGQQAFLQLARSISQANIEIQRGSGLINGLWANLKNVAKWQISSTILMGFTRAVTDTISYVKDLNSALNDIQIVSGLGADEMERFANSANKAAKTLSASTLDYTKAALIYYQQGDFTTEQIKERTDATQKMMNVTKESAEDVSSYMTAIWNNFDDGSKKIEYYADALTKLGAETAASTAEIAEGLEKFAGIADTIGLSYEYATSAVTTLVAQTRESPESVGTALKTLFSRLQGLKLGETLDDGTTLNKYSEAMKVVGVDIKNSNGELKQANEILDEMGKRWNYISQDQKMALAQTVGGVRQYTKLITLMDNYDTFKVNIDLASNAEGTLNEQQAIFEESWEASSKRVEASLQDLYSSLVPEDFFIGFNDSMTEVVDSITKFVDSLGGAAGLISMLGAIMFTVFSQQIAGGINTALANMKIFSGISQQEMNRVQAEAHETAMAMTEGMGNGIGIEATRSALQNTYELQNKLNAKIKDMSPEQAKIAQHAMEIANQYSDIAVEASKAAEEAKEMAHATQESAIASRKASAETMKSQMTRVQTASGSRLSDLGGNILFSASTLGITEGVSKARVELEAYRNLLTNVNASESELTQAQNNLKNALLALSPEIENSSMRFDKFESNVNEIASTVVQSQQGFESFKNSMLNTSSAPKNLKEELEKMLHVLTETGMISKNTASSLGNLAAETKQTNPKKSAEAFENFKKVLKNVSINSSELVDAILRLGLGTNQTSGETRKMAKAALEAATAEERYKIALENAKNKTAEAGAVIQNTGLKYKSLGSAITGTFSAMTSMSMAMSSLSSLKDTISNEDLSAWDKFSQILMSLGMAVPALTMTMSSLGNIYKFVTSATTEGMMAQIGYALGMDKQAMKAKEVVMLTTGEAVGLDELNKEQFKSLGLKGLTLAQYNALDKAKKKELLTTNGQIIKEKIHTKAIWSHIWAQRAKLAQTFLIIAALAALAAAIYFVATAESKEEKAMKAATEGLKESERAYQEATKAVEDFKAAVEEYDQGIEALKDLKEHTEEYTIAVEESNKKARELIETYKLFDNFKFENGIITLDSGALKDIEEQKEEQARKAENLKLRSQAGVSLAELAKETKDLQTALKYYKAYKEDDVSIAMGYGSLKDENAVLQDLVLTKEEANLQFKDLASVGVEQTLTEEELKSIAKAFRIDLEENGANTFEGVKEQLEEIGFGLLAEEVWELKDSLIRYDQVLQDTAEELAYYNREIIGNIVENNYDDEITDTFLGKEHLAQSGKEAIISLVSKKDEENAEGIGQSVKTFEQEINSKDSISNSGTESYIKNTIFKGKTEAEQKQILDNLGLTKEDIDSISENDEHMALVYAKLLRPDLDPSELSYTGGNGKSQVTDASGNKIFGEEMLNDKVIRRQMLKMIANATVEEEYKNNSENKDNVEEALKAVDRITDATLRLDEELGAGFSEVILNSISNDGKIDLSDVMSTMGPGTAELIKSYLFDENGDTKDPEELLKFLGITEEDLKAAGLGSAEDFQKGWAQAFENFDVEDYFESKKAAAIGKDRARLIQYEKEYTEALAKRNKAMDEGDEQAQKAAEEEMRAAEERYAQYEKEKKIIEQVSAKLKNLRDNKEVEASYKKIMENPASTSVATEEAYAEVAGYIGSEFGVDLSADELRTRWNEIKPLLDSEELEWGQIQQILYNIQAPDSFEDFKNQVGALEEPITDLSGELKTLTNEELDNLWKKIDNFDPKVDGFDTLLTSITDCMGPAAGLEYTLKNLKNVVPENLMTTYTVYSRVLSAQTGGTLNTDSAWGSYLSKDLGTDYITRDAQSIDILKKNGFTIFENSDQFVKWKEKNYPNSKSPDFLNEWIAFYGKEGDQETLEFVSGGNALGNALEVLQKDMSKQGAPGEAVIKFVMDDPEGDPEKSKSNSTSATKHPRSKEYIKASSDYQYSKEQVDLKDAEVEAAITNEEKSTKLGDKIAAQKKSKDFLKIFIDAGNKEIKSNISSMWNGSTWADTIVGYTSEGNPVKLSDIFNNPKTKEWGEAITKEINFQDGLTTEELAKLSVIQEELYNAWLPSFQTAAEGDDTQERFNLAFEFLTSNFDDIKSLQGEVDQNNLSLKEVDQKIGADSIKKLNIDNAIKENELEKSDKKIDLFLARTEDSDVATYGLARVKQRILKAENDQTRYQLAKENEEYYKSLYDQKLISEEEYNDIKIETLEAENALLSTQKEIYDELNTVIGEFSSKIEDLVSNGDTYITMIEDFSSILENLSTENDLMAAKLGKVTINMMGQNLVNIRGQLNHYKSVREELEAALIVARNTNNEAAISSLEEQLDEAKKNELDAQQNLISELSSTLDKVVEIYESNIDRILENWSEAAAGIATDLEALEDSYSKEQELSKQYLDSETQLYELEKMRRTINKELASNQNLVAVQKLSDVLEDINAIQAKGLEMSEYDLKMLQAKYDLRKAEIELEEAQNNKTEVRLMRNAQGNWSYVFTANQDAISDAEQKVADEREKLSNESEQYLQEVQGNLIKMEKERQEAIGEAYKEYRDDEAALQKETTRINAYYAKQYDYYGSEMNKVLGVLGKDFTETSYSILTGYGSWDEAQQKFAKNGEDAITSLDGAYQEHKNQISSTLQSAGMSYKTFTEDLETKYVPAITSSMGSIVDEIEDKTTAALGTIKSMLLEIISSMGWIQYEGSGAKVKVVTESDGDAYTALDYDGDNKADSFFAPAARGYDTGGYTGDWGTSDGKIAILHEKELVLNKTDTSNILSAVEIMRQLVNAANLSRANLSNKYYAPTAKPNEKKEIEQNVHIDASFPGVQNAIEIENALNNIINDVSQYSWKK